MNRRPLIPVDVVSNIELFYDLSFAYCISVLTTLLYHVEGSFIDLGTWLTYMFAFLVVLQVWFYSTVLNNHYGDGSVADNVSMFINMFLLYFMAASVQMGWTDTYFTFNIAWALILVNLGACCVIKLVTYNNLTDDDLFMLFGMAAMMGLQAMLALLAAFMPEEVSIVVSVISLIFGVNMWWLMRRLEEKHVRFVHIAERCSLLVIVMFGQTVVAISPYATTTSSLLYPIFVFALVVGLFLIYIYERDNMIDLNYKTTGVGYMNLTVWLVVILGNLTVALSFMPNRSIASEPKNHYLLACLVLYLLTSFLIGRYNKPELKPSVLFVAGRLAVCVVIVATALITNYDPLITLIVDTLAVFFAVWHEWLLYHTRMGNIKLGLGLFKEE